jgi:hypothetical protein
MKAQQPTFGLRRVVTPLLLFGILVMLLLVWRPPAADAATHPCSNLKGIGVTKIVAQNIRCGEAHLVVRLWRRSCNYAGACQVEGGGLPEGTQFLCKGTTAFDGRLKMECVNNQNRTEKVRFKATPA